LYTPGPPGIEQMVAAVSTRQKPEPVAVPETATVTPDTGPPLDEVTVTVMAIGSGHGSGRQSGSVS